VGARTWWLLVVGDLDHLQQVLHQVLHLQNAAQMPLFLLQQVLQHLLQNEDLSSAYRIPGRILSFAHHCCGWMRDGEGSCWKTDFFARAIDSLSLLHINLLQMQIACAAGDGLTDLS
jgi:hypothetical protein